MVQLPMLRSRGSFRLLKKSPEGVAFSRKKKVEKNKQLKSISINYDRKSVIDPALTQTKQTTAASFQAPSTTAARINLFI